MATGLLAVWVTTSIALGGLAVAARPHPVKHPKKARSAPSANAEVEGRNHLKKGNALAGQGDCKAAVDEYTQAFDRLNDPLVLLARAECFRRLGQADEAIGDYRAYLDESPDVSNRAEIEAKIAALEGGGPREKPHAEPAPAPAPPAPVAVPPPPPARVPAPAEVPPPPPARAVSPVPPPAVEIEVGQKPPESPKPSADAAGEGSSRVWLWAAIGVLVTGAAVAGGYFYFRPSEPSTTGTLGGYRF